jgi:hypothetical protein
VLLLSPPVQDIPDEHRIENAIRVALQGATMRDAVEEVRRTLRVPRKQVYDLALRIQEDGVEDHDR